MSFAISIPATVKSIAPGVVTTSIPTVPSLDVILENIMASPVAFDVSNLLLSYAIGVSSS